MHAQLNDHVYVGRLDLPTSRRKVSWVMINVYVLITRFQGCVNRLSKTSSPSNGTVTSTMKASALSSLRIIRSGLRAILSPGTTCFKILHPLTEEQHLPVASGCCYGGSSLDPHEGDND